jgi:hypothetical protein
MKFLCVPCDKPMKLQEVEGPDQGSLTIVYHCSECAHRIALLTNPLETQLVKALDVKIGAGSVAPTEPLRFTRSSLARQREETFLTGEPGEAVEAAKDPGGCPFTAIVREAEGGELIWTEAAEQRLQRIPGFVRPWAKKAIEDFATEKGYRTITGTVMDEAREKIGM